MKKQESKQSSRREFLRNSAVAGAGAAIVASSPAIALTESEQIEEESRGYRVTEHIAAYYKTAAE